MADSLLLADQFELLGGGASTTARLGEGWSLGSAEPDTATISSLFLDGEVITGDRTHNRTITLPIEILGTGIVTRTDIGVVVNAIASAVNVRSGTTFTLQWTPDGGLPVIFDCYRATLTHIRNVRRNGQLVGHLDLTFQAQPFGRSTVVQSVVGTVAASLQLDNFDAARTGATLNTTTKYEGTGSNQVPFGYSGSGFNPGSTAQVSGSLSSVNISAYASASVRVSMLSGGPFTFSATLTLTSSGGSASWTASVTATAGGWGLATFDLTATPTTTTGTGVSLTAVTGYTIRLFDRYANLTGLSALIDDLRAVPPTSSGVTTTRAALFNVAGVMGSARAPVRISLNRGAGQISTLLLHSPPADQDPDASILIPLSTSVADQHITVNPANARYDGTYAVYLSVFTQGTGTTTVTVTFNQNSTASQAITLTYTAPVTGALLYVGNVTLPVLAIADDNTTIAYDIEVNVTAGTARMSELLLCDTRGQTITAIPSFFTESVYVEEPDPVTGFGQILASGSLTRAGAMSILGSSFVVGGPIIFEPGANKILAIFPGANSGPTLTATLYPRWLDERTQ